MSDKKYSTFKKVCEELIPFNRFLGIKLGKVQSGKVRLLLPFRKEFIGDTGRPAIHGGVLSTLMDTAGGAAALTRLNHGDRLSTVDLLVDYLLPASAGDLRADAEVIRIGNQVAVVQISVRQKRKLIANGRAVYNVVRSKQN